MHTLVPACRPTYAGTHILTSDSVATFFRRKEGNKKRMSSELLILMGQKVEENMQAKEKGGKKIIYLNSIKVI